MVGSESLELLLVSLLVERIGVIELGRVSGNMFLFTPGGSITIVLTFFIINHTYFNTISNRPPPPQLALPAA